jgi:hypothetical protein
MAKTKSESKAQEGEVVTAKTQTIEVKKINPGILILGVVFMIAFLCGLCAFVGSLPFLLS